MLAGTAALPTLVGQLGRLMLVVLAAAADWTAGVADARDACRRRYLSTACWTAGAADARDACRRCGAGRLMLVGLTNACWSAVAADARDACRRRGTHARDACRNGGLTNTPTLGRLMLVMLAGTVALLRLLDRWGG